MIKQVFLPPFVFGIILLATAAAGTVITAGQRSTMLYETRQEESTLTCKKKSKCSVFRYHRWVWQLLTRAQRSLRLLSVGVRRESQSQSRNSQRSIMHRPRRAHGAPLDFPGHRDVRLVVEGNIGSGKTTVMNALADKGYSCYPEPVESWEGLLIKASQNPETYSVDLQRCIRTQGAVSMRGALPEGNHPCKYCCPYLFVLAFPPFGLHGGSERLSPVSAFTKGWI